MRTEIPLRGVAALLLLAAPAAAQITAVGPFSGQYSEGFEAHPAGAYAGCAPAPLLGGLATACTPGTSGTTVTTSQVLNCTVTAHDGANFLASVDGALELTFHQPVRRFGAYFAVNTTASDADVTFFDWEGQVIGGAAVPAKVPSGCAWHWNGWESPDVAIARIEIAGFAFNDGAFVQLDDLEVDTTAIVGEFCFGDGPSAVCPCGNQSVSGRGCANSVGSDGGRLFATGSASLGAGDLRLHAEGLPAGELVVFASGSVAPLSSPVLVADGLRCLTGPLRRVEVALASSTGVASTLQLPALAEGLLAGDARHYQAWYRDAFASPCGGGANFTQGVSVQWVP